MEKIDKNTKLKDLPEEVVEKLFKEAWERYQERKKKGRSENSKNFAKDETNQHVEKINSKSEKAKLSTEKRGDSPESPEAPENTGETGETGEPRGVSVDDSKKSQSHETKKNRISARLIDRDVVEDGNGHRVTIEAYDTGQYEDYVMSDKVVRQRQIKFILKYKSIVKECIGRECKNAVKEIARATHYNVSSKDIMAKIDELREDWEIPEEVPLTDYVKQKYPDRLAEIERDPITWITSRTKEIVGYDRLKLLTFLSLVSSRMERIMGMSRIHVMVVGGSGTGKSSTVKSVLKFADDIVIQTTRITQNALGYLPIDTFDGHVLFIEQIDRQNMNYLRELMTEEKVCTTVTEKATGDDGEERLVSRQRCIEGQPAVITTSVVDTIDVDKEQIFNRMLKVYVKTDQSVEDKIWKAIMTRGKNDVDPVDAMTFKAWLLTRPAYAKIPEDVTNAVINFMKKLKEYTREPLNRTVEVARNLIIVTAIMRGRTEATLEDWQFVEENFQLDLLYNGLGLSERDVEFIEVLPDDKGLKSSEVADKLRVSKQYAINVLKNLERKGLVEADKEDGKTFAWYLTPLGRKIKDLVNNVGDVIEVRNEKGELIGAIDSKFRSESNAGNDREDAMRGDDSRTMQRGDGETDRAIEAYKWLKEHGSISTAELTELFGNDIIEKLKAKDLVTFNVMDGVEYVIAK
ncbi:helix-turn-helix domain-containing protein [Saccharolobus islandicus]|uniref:Transcriptional regulator, MarR family n=1 Tax=Saccharolobus islandicus (strain M.16.4 / Kamchatka \|nr:helix-turn-helix domain-containing protein [Sulfolobus islandicus]ACR40788.1 transcriptional regulator, MarR family [Sulfolobus islandicus M.16.4]